MGRKTHTHTHTQEKNSSVNERWYIMIIMKPLPSFALLCIIIIIFVCFVTVLVKLHKSSWEGKLINVMELKPYVSKLHSFGFYKQLSAFPEQGERERGGKKKAQLILQKKKCFYLYKSLEMLIISVFSEP